MRVYFCVLQPCRFRFLILTQVSWAPPMCPKFPAPGRWLTHSRRSRYICWCVLISNFKWVLRYIHVLWATYVSITGRNLSDKMSSSGTWQGFRSSSQADRKWFKTSQIKAHDVINRGLSVQDPDSMNSEECRGQHIILTKSPILITSPDFLYNKKLTAKIELRKVKNARRKQTNRYQIIKRSINIDKRCEKSADSRDLRHKASCGKKGRCHR